MRSGMVMVAVPGVPCIPATLSSNESHGGMPKGVLAPLRLPGSSCPSSASRPSNFSYRSSSAFISDSLADWWWANHSRRVGRLPQLVVNARLAGGSARDGSLLLDFDNDRVELCRVFSSSFRRRRTRNGRWDTRMFVENGGARRQGNHGETGRDTLEHSRRLLAKQKELLEQVDAALGRNSAHPLDQKKSQNDSNKAIQSQREPTTGGKGDQMEIFESDSADENLQASFPPRSQEVSQSVPRRPLASLWPSAKIPGTSEPGKAKTNPPIQSRVNPLSQASASPALAPAIAPAPFPRADPVHSTYSPGPSSTAAPKEEPEQGSAARVEAPPPLAGPNVMNIVVVAAECAPWSKTGGLGDVVGALPKALARRGHRVMVVAPRYSNYKEAWDTSVRKVYNVGGQNMEIGYFHGYRDKVDYVFVDSPMFHAHVGNIYGGTREDVLLRMVLLCKAAIEAPWHVPCGGVTYGDGNLIFIANDWHTALLPVYLQAYYHEKGLMSYVRCVLVIHNMAHQGRGPFSDFGKLGLPAHFADKFRMYDPIGGEHCNVFKAGFITCHRIVAVSHGYAHEVQTSEGGWGLDGVIRDNNWKLRGVVNGIDDQEWNPEIDLCLKDDGYLNYGKEDLSGKATCKAALQKELGLPVRKHVPLIGFIGRLDSQKGVDIIADAMPWMMHQDLQLVMLGTGRKDLEDMLRTMECQHKDKVRGWVGFSVKTAHRITAGVDILLMPSRFEPCGLNQLYAMRYGTVPVVHAVGGLKDTVQPFDPFAESGTGWTFDRAHASGLIHALGNAMWTYHDFKPSWEGIQRRGMTLDLSWDNAAHLYEEVLVAAKYQW